ncbi:MAG: hypothetical protein IKX19_12755, partial [Clostridia bacterium]|nr:hypothetical protein [Clostridia bacterium]
MAGSPAASPLTMIFAVCRRLCRAVPGDTWRAHWRKTVCAQDQDERTAAFLRTDRTYPYFSAEGGPRRMNTSNSWHLLDNGEVLRLLTSDMYRGLTSKEAKKRRRTAGSNSVWHVKRTPAGEIAL